MKKCGKIIDLHHRRIFDGCIEFRNGKIIAIYEKENDESVFICPGFIDAHVHIESSMLIPSRFAELAVRNGTIAIVNDPHEISNVLDIDGFKFMIDESKTVNFKFFFGVPSCVPATPLETSGGNIDASKVEELLNEEKVVALSEVMNYPGVINGDVEVLAKIKAAQEKGKRIDGHAPGLKGKNLDKYIAAGVETDHEAYSFEEGEEKIKKGMCIQIRQGSAAKNFNALYRLIDKYPDRVMLCTDDSHPDTLIKGHINKILKLGVSKGLDIFNLLRAATVNPALFYKLDVGLLRVGDSADFVVLKDLKDFDVLETYINGERVFDGKKTCYSLGEYKRVNKFREKAIDSNSLKVIAKTSTLQAIKCFDGELITEKELINVEKGSEIKATSELNKLVVLNRYSNYANPAIGFITGFGLKKGAIATSIAHDSHNIIAVGVDDNLITLAINKIIENKGGIVVVTDQNDIKDLKLDVAGIMTGEDPEWVAKKYEEIEKTAKELGTELSAPLMTLSFMALLVIPKLKLGDKGLFDGEIFNFTSNFIEKNE